MVLLCAKMTRDVTTRSRAVGHASRSWGYFGAWGWAFKGSSAATISPSAAWIRTARPLGRGCFVFTTSRLPSPSANARRHPLQSSGEGLYACQL